MGRKGILSVGLLLFASLVARAQEQPNVVALQSEIEQLRRERDASEARLRIVQDQLDEARKTAVAERLEIEALEFRCKKLQDELKQVQALAENLPLRVLPDALPSVKPALKPLHGKITAMSGDLHLLQVSIGLDAGLKLGQTLDVYRLGVEKGKTIPLYLGTLRVTRVDPQASLGEYQRVPGLDRAPKIGDEVSNELNGK